MRHLCLQLGLRCLLQYQVVAVVEPSLLEGVHHIHLIQGLLLMSVHVLVEDGHQQLRQVVIQQLDPVSCLLHLAYAHLLLDHVDADVLRQGREVVRADRLAEVLLVHGSEGVV